jgi:uncharacterized protein
MGVPILIGSLFGSFSSKLMTENGINVIYGILGLIAVVLMFIPKKGNDEVPFDQVKVNKWIAAILGLIVGVSAGIVGAGGAFILVPIMLVVLKIPTRITIATSLAITLLSSIGTTIGKLTTGQVEYIPALILVVASLLASPLGAFVGKKINTKILQWILALLIIATSIKIWSDILL